MRYLQILLLLPLGALVGCPMNAKPTAPPTVTTGGTPVMPKGGPPVAPEAEESAVDLTAPAAGAVVINPENSKIEFVGTKPNGKHDGGFKKFLGGIELEDNAVTKVTLEIDAGSLYSDNPKLTGHLKTPDFFDVKTHPKASFVSTGIKADTGKDATHKITGDLTLRGVKKSVTIPAKIEVTADDVAVNSQFTIDRTEFGMTYGKGKVDDTVTIKVSVKAARK